MAYSFFTGNADGGEPPDRGWCNLFNIPNGPRFATQAPERADVLEPTEKKNRKIQKEEKPEEENNHRTNERRLGESGVLSRPSASVTLCRTSWPPYAGCRIGGVSA